MKRSVGALFGCALLAWTYGCGGGDPSGEGGAGGEGGASPPKYEPFAVQSQTWDFGSPSAQEQGLLELIQRARMNPTAEAAIVVEDPGAKGAMQQFGVNPQDVIADFQTYVAVPPLAWDAKLMVSSKAHSDDMATNGFQDHNGSDGSQFFERITKAGYDWSFCTENIFAYADNVPYCHAAFMIDWGNPELGHRLTTLDMDGRKRDIGISVIENPSSSKVGPLVVTEDFGMPLEAGPNAVRFVVGVVFMDQNLNGSYDIGEGVPGATIVPNVGDYAAITAPGGGFVLPEKVDAGALSVQVQIDGVALDQKDVTIAKDNVKVDFALAPGHT